ncbi:hypothetical protein D3C84_723650 [compost metagenome]
MRRNGHGNRLIAFQRLYSWHNWIGGSGIESAGNNLCHIRWIAWLVRLVSTGAIAAVVHRKRITQRFLRLSARSQRFGVVLHHEIADCLEVLARLKGFGIGHAHGAHVGDQELADSHRETLTLPLQSFSGGHRLAQRLGLTLQPSTYNPNCIGVVGRFITDQGLQRLLVNCRCTLRRQFRERHRGRLIGPGLADRTSQSQHRYRELRQLLHIAPPKCSGGRRSRIPTE